MCPHAAITCPPVLAPISGSVTYGIATVNSLGDFPFSTMATYACNEGFALMGDPTSTCTGDGTTVNGAFDIINSPSCEGECMCIPLCAV